ncbi:TolC family protein [Saccharicrinis sp. FJH2]|uniref:TolC family protein n=1 Tax=Saccharicrinis sp. FJH65 TaxID=3344659 RepID=UPI0035F31911
MKKNFLLTVVAFLFISSSFQGQTIHRLTLDECVELAGEQSFQMRKSKSAYEIAKFGYLVQTSNLKTNIDFSFNPVLSKTYNPQTDFTNRNGENLYRSNYVTSTNSFIIISQPLPTGGYIEFEPGFSATTRNYFTKFDDDVIADPGNKTLTFNPSFKLTQPLNSFYVFNRYKYIQKSADLNFERAEISYKQVKFLIQYQIGILYFQIQNILQDIEVQKLLLSTKKSVYNKFLPYGETDNSELIKLKIEVERTETNLNNLYYAYTSKVNDLKQQLALPEKDSILIDNKMAINEYLINTNKLIKVATERHLLIKRYNIDIKLDELKYKEIKAESLLKADLSLYFNPYSSVAGEADISYMDLMSDVWDQSARRTETLNDLSLGLRISLPIYEAKRTKNQMLIKDEEIRINKINIEEQEELIQKNIHTLVEQIAYTLENIKIIETMMESSQQNMEDGIQKFYNEATDTYRLAYDLKLWEDARLNYSAMQMNYNLLINRLEYEILDHLENVQ